MLGVIGVDSLDGVTVESPVGDQPIDSAIFDLDFVDSESRFFNTSS